jgi:signal transduction histidine kinase
VNEVIGEMISLLRSEAGRHAISIHTELAPELPKVSADRVQLQQVLMNLMLNGIEAISEGKVAGRLTIKSQQNPEDQVLISVSDTGIGLPPDRADKVFDAFFTTKPKGKGTGLSISRSIIESHGGRYGPPETLIGEQPSVHLARRTCHDCQCINYLGAPVGPAVAVAVKSQC